MRLVGTRWGHNYGSYSLYAFSLGGISYREGLGTHLMVVLKPSKDAVFEVLSPVVSPA